MNAQKKIEAAKKEPDNLRIWNVLAKTDPKHTKPFSRAGGFKGTALKPIWVVKRLTELFGPCGEGWGIGEPRFETVASNGDILVYCTVSCWHGSPENTLYGVGGDKAAGKNKNGPFTDDEAFKKAFTDAVNNAFKFVGVGGDIHMGQFDDSKYVSAIAKEFETGERDKKPEVAPKEQPGDISPTALGASLKLLVHNLHGCGDLGELEGLLATEDVQDVVEQCQRRAPHWYETGDGMPAEFTPLKTLVENRRKELEAAEDQFNNTRTPIDAG